MVAYCLFCNTVKCDGIAKTLRSRYLVTALTPKIVQRKWVRGECFDVTHDYLPGYVFVYADEPIDGIVQLARGEDYVLRLLGEKDELFQLRGADYAFAEMLYRCGGVINTIRVYREGDRVKLAKGEWGNVEGEIIKTDRRGRALVRYTFDKTTYNVWVGYEIIEGSGEAV